MTAPSWLPDWTQAAAYPGADVPLLHWPWQFLRRNRQYQELWDRIIRPHYDPSDGSIESGPSFQSFRDRFGIMLPPPPEYDAAGGNLFAINWVSTWRPTEPWPVEPGIENDYPQLIETEYYVKIDYSKPLTPQIESLRKDAEAQQRLYVKRGGVVKRTTINRSSFPVYIRLLDAETAGATQSEMAKRIFPDLPNDYSDTRGRDKVKDCLAAARRYRDGHYMHIAAAAAAEARARRRGKTR